MFDYNDPELNEIRKSVKKLAQNEIPKFQNEDYYGTVPKELFNSFAALGLTGLSVSEEYGGLAANALTTATVMEEIAAVDLGPAIFLSVHCMVSGIINKYAESTQVKLLPDLAAGNLLAGFALTEPSAGSDAAALKTHAELSGDVYILNGEKCYITSAGFADLFLVFAKTSPEKGKAGISTFIVEANSDGLSVSTPEKKMGCELSPIASLTLSNVKVPASNLLGELDKGYSIALSGLAGGRINVASAANGLSRSAINLATAHLCEREQFGSKLIDFQGLQFMLADMRTLFEAAILLTVNAARTLSDNPTARENRIYSSMAKCFATDAAMKITTDAVQLLGGAGYIKEYQVERLMRDAKMLQIVEGTNQIQRSLIAREMVNN